MIHDHDPDPITNSVQGLITVVGGASETYRLSLAKIFLEWKIKFPWSAFKLPNSTPKMEASSSSDDRMQNAEQDNDNDNRGDEHDEADAEVFRLTSTTLLSSWS